MSEETQKPEDQSLDASETEQTPQEPAPDEVAAEEELTFAEQETGTAQEIIGHEEGEAQAKAAGGRNLRKELIGTVTSNKMDKTITVAIERKVKHPVYGKFVKKTTKFAAHDEKEDAGIGDIVRLMSTRPLSKSKRWRLVEILERAK
jgi:small subunit ribosomal protein S17